MDRGWIIGWTLIFILFSACSRPEPPDPPDGSARAAGREALEGIQACQKAMVSAQRSAPDGRAALVAGGCKGLFPPGPCRDTLAQLSSVPPEARAVRVIDVCIRPLCPRLADPRPRLCTAEPALAPGEQLDALREFQLAWLQAQVCPELPAPRPKLCDLSAPPDSAAGHQMLLLDLQRAAGERIPIETRALIMGLGLVASLGAIPVKAPGPPKVLALKPKPALKAHLFIKGDGLWLSFPERDGRGWALPKKPAPADLSAAMASLAGSPLKPKVALSADAGVPYEALVILMDALTSAGFDQIVLAPRQD